MSFLWRRDLGHFCGKCGEKEVSEEDYALRHYFVEMVTDITLLESKSAPMDVA